MFVILRSSPSVTIDTRSNSLVEELIARDVQYHRDSRLQINEGLVVSTATSSRRSAPRDRTEKIVAEVKVLEEENGNIAGPTRRALKRGEQGEVAGAGSERWRQIEKIVSREVYFG